METVKEKRYNKYIGDKAFYRTLIMLVLPIMIQNGITNFVSLLDNIMIGRVGTEQMSGVAIVNQIMFIYFLCLFGGLSGAGIFTRVCSASSFIMRFVVPFITESNTSRAPESFRGESHS